MFVCTAEGSQARQEGRLQEEAVLALPVPWSSLGGGRGTSGQCPRVTPAPLTDAAFESKSKESARAGEALFRKMFVVQSKPARGH